MVVYSENLRCVKSEILYLKMWSLLLAIFVGTSLLLSYTISRKDIIYIASLMKVIMTSLMHLVRVTDFYLLTYLNICTELYNLNVFLELPVHFSTFCICAT